jgi:hypothetical protein
MIDAARLTVAAGLTFGLYIAVYYVQTLGLAALQRSLIGTALPFAAVSLLHGVRMLTAWIFGWWSIAVLAPAAAFIYARNLFDGGVGPQIDYQFHIVAMAFLISGPLSLHVMSLVLPERERNSRFEWRVLLLAGFLSAFLNSIVYGVMLIPYDPLTSGLLWFGGHVMSQVAGLLVFLVAIALVMRLWGQGPAA